MMTEARQSIPAARIDDPANIATADGVVWPVDPRHRSAMPANRRVAQWLVLAIAILLLSALTLFQQERLLGLRFIETIQLARHQEVMAGIAPNPWRYRVLSEWLVSPVLRLMERSGVPRPIALGFLLFRFVQNLVVFTLACVFYRRLRFPTTAVLLGISILAWVIMNSFFNGDLSLNAYTETAFYLVAAIAIDARRPVWILPLTFLAALNRETSGLIPIMVLVHGSLRGDHRSGVASSRLAASRSRSSRSCSWPCGRSMEPPPTIGATGAPSPPVRECCGGT
jgi:hypothetical protein